LLQSKAQEQILIINTRTMKTNTRTKIHQNERLIKHPENDFFISVIDKASKLLLIPVFVFFIWVFYQIIINA